LNTDIKINFSFTIFIDLNEKHVFLKEPYRHEKRYFIGNVHGHLTKFLLLSYHMSLLVIVKELRWMNQE
jgi:hypothetical protein